MSEPIIIEIPSPTCRARFVLVHVGQCSGTTCGIPRDATPADLLRAGYVPREVPSAEAWKAAHAEAERELIRARAALAEQPDPGTLAHLRADLRDAVKRAEKAERERDEALGRAQSETEWRVRAVSERQDAEAERDDLRAELAEARKDREDWAAEAKDLRAEPALNVHTSAGRDATPADLARGGYVRDDDTRAGLRDALRARERAELDALAELDEQRARAEKAEGLLIQRETELRLAREDGDERARDLRQAYERAMAAAEKAERELAAAVAEVRCRGDRMDELGRRAEKAERERDEALLRAHTGVVHYEILRQSGEEAARQRDEARAELARLTAPGEGSDGEPGFARQQPRDRATDLELIEAYIAEARPPVAVDHDGVFAVAARVRQERCLVAQAVARGWYIYLCPQKNDPSKWDIETGRVIAGRSDGGAILHGVPASDVPATLARLLGEVSR